MEAEHVVKQTAGAVKRRSMAVHPDPQLREHRRQMALLHRPDLQTDPSIFNSVYKTKIHPTLLNNQTDFVQKIKIGGRKKQLKAQK